MAVSQFCDDSSPGGPVDKAPFDKVRLVYVLNGDGFLPQYSGQGLQPHRSPVVMGDDGRQHPPVDVIKPQLVHFKAVEGGIDDFTASLWENLNQDNKVSLFTRFISLESGKAETRIVNKNQ